MIEVGTKRYPYMYTSLSMSTCIPNMIDFTVKTLFTNSIEYSMIHLAYYTRQGYTGIKLLNTV